jgi:hypothetical protein
MFYAIAATAIAGDITVFQICNSMPPPIPISPSAAQNHANVSGILLQTNATTPIVAAGISGTLNTLSIMATASSPAGGGAASLTLIDGASKIVWQTELALGASATQTIPINLTGLSLRFANGLNLIVGASSFSGDYVVVNVYYSTP